MVPCKGSGTIRLVLSRGSRPGAGSVHAHCVRIIWARYPFPAQTEKDLIWGEGLTILLEGLEDQQLGMACVLTAF